MLNRLLRRGLAASVLAVALSTAAARAGPQDRTLTGIGVQLDADCVAQVTWTPLRGGKPMFAHVVLKYFDGGAYRTVLLAGANDFHKVKQNAGALELDFGALAAVQGASGYRVEVNFVDSKDLAISGVVGAESACGGSA